MSETNAFTHLTLEERKIILTGITNGSTKTAIAQIIGKDNSTIGKEIKQHRVLVSKCALPLECINYKKCKRNRGCSPDCLDYVQFTCTRRDRSPGACNGCSNWTKCRFDKYRYNPDAAHQDYRERLVDSRSGANLTTQEAKTIADTVAPLLRQGQSPYQIVTNHPELRISEKTLYNYIENGVLKELSGITALDLRRQVSRKLPKQRTQQYKKRKDWKFLSGRTYADYLEYLSENPDSFVTQMDTVYNNESEGPFIQTFKFIQASVLLAIRHESKTALSMKQGVDLLSSVLGEQVFMKYCPVILTDRGTEFSDADGIESGEDGIRRTRIFYCDPMRSGQKGSLENNHIELRYILPKGTDLTELGLKNQSDLNRALSHINSSPCEKLGGKSPLELTRFLYPDLYEKLLLFGLQEVEKDRVVLKPYLLKK